MNISIILLNPCNYSISTKIQNIHKIYGKNFYDFYNSIPKEYEHKETILKALFKIKDKLMRTAPENMSQTYIDETMRLIKFLPKNQTDWDSIKSWNIIRNASIEANKIIATITSSY